MHPKLISFESPNFLHSILPETITIYWYGFLIVIGALLGIVYTAINAKRKYGLKYDDANTLFLILLVSAIIGGKLFYYFEDPSYYNDHFNQLATGRGFVFFGSLLFTIPCMYWFFKFHKLPVGGMLDIMAITTCIVHAFGRLGCFMAGCCYGIPWEGTWSVIFKDNESLAVPLNTNLHPTQLYSSFMILLIMLILIRISKRKSFDGQVFLSYLILYSTGRGIIEIFRGDLTRGFIIEHYISHSQLISFILIISCLIIYHRFWSKAKFNPGKEV